MESSSEERKRRIMERGSDRMALITGQLQSLSPSPSSSSSISHHRAKSDSCASMSLSQDHLPPKIVPTYSIEDFGSRTAEAEKFAPIPPKAPERAQSTIPEPKPGNHIRFFSSRRLNLSIINSETTRSFCALIIACIVVLSYIDCLLMGSNIISSASIVALKPLSVLLVTDAVIIFTRMFIEASERSEDSDGERKSSGNWADAEKLLERGLVAYQAFRAVFVDCSIYMVVVICGLHFA